MTRDPLGIVILGLSLTSSWGNGHATTYRCLVQGLTSLGHRVHFLERDTPWYAAHRDLPHPPYGRTSLYTSLAELQRAYLDEVRAADLVIVGSYVPDGIAVGEWVTKEAGGMTAFYDIDTPVTLARLHRGELEYLSAELIPKYDLYLSFTGGGTLRLLEERWESPRALPLFCSADPEVYRPAAAAIDRDGTTAQSAGNGAAAPGTSMENPSESRYDLGYMGTYSDDRQPVLEELLIEPARRWKEGRFVVAGPRYPDSTDWGSIERIEHLPPDEHPGFYASQRFTLNVTRSDMIEAGYSPSVRLFEAAACGTPVISDYWEGLDTFFLPDREILISRSAKETLEILRDFPEEERLEVGRSARARLLSEHTPEDRARTLEGYVTGKPSAAVALPAPQVP